MYEQDSGLLWHKNKMYVEEFHWVVHSVENQIRPAFGEA
jgi:hypothetical protein